MHACTTASAATWQPDDAGAAFAVWAPNARLGLGDRRLERLGRPRPIRSRRARMPPASGKGGATRRAARPGLQVPHRHAPTASVLEKADPFAFCARGAAGDGVAHLVARLRRGATHDWMQARAERNSARCADLDLRGAPRLVARATDGAAARLPRARARARRLRRRAWASRTSSSCRSRSIRSTARGATRPPATSRRPRATARRRTSCTSSTTCTSAASACMLDWVPSHFPDRRARARLLRRHAPLRACRSAPGLPSRVEQRHLQLRPPRGAQLPDLVGACSGSTATTSTACASTRWPRCSTSTTRASGGEWIPNRARRPREPRGRSTSCRQLNRAVYREHPDTFTDRRGVDRLADGVAARSTWAASASA